MSKWLLLIPIFVLSVVILALVELMPEKYKKAARLVLIPVTWIISIMFGFVFGIFGFIISAIYFFNSCTQNGLSGMVRDVSELTKWIDDE